MVDKQQLAAMGEHMREVEECKTWFKVPDGWIEWKGGKCPVDGDVNVKFWSGTIKETPISARELYWEHDGDISDTIAYPKKYHDELIA